MFQKRRLVFLIGIIAALLSLAFLVAACGDDDDDDGDGGGPPAATEPADGDGEPPAATEPPADDVSTSLDVVLAEFSVTVSLDSAGAGAVTFGIANDGALQHNFRVIATDLAADSLPVIEDEFIVDEEAVDVLATTADLDAGGTEEVSLDLAAGSYVLICNIPSHYESGMFTAFTVQ